MAGIKVEREFEMPHVQITGRCELRRFWETFEPRTQREGDRIVKSIQSYLAHADRSVIVECSVVEGYLRQQIMVQTSLKEDRTIVGLFHALRPEKSAGVRFCIGWIASQLIEQNRDTGWETDNLGLSPHPFLPERS